MSTWQATIPVEFGTHTLTLEAIDYRGVVVGSDTFTVTSTHSDRPLEDFLRISEVMYHPAGATPSEIAAGFTDAEKFEFVELVNTSDGIRHSTSPACNSSTGSHSTSPPPRSRASLR